MYVLQDCLCLVWTSCYMHMSLALLADAGCLHTWLVKSTQDAPGCRLLLSLGRYEGILEGEIVDSFYAFSHSKGPPLARSGRWSHLCCRKCAHESRYIRGCRLLLPLGRYEGIPKFKNVSCFLASNHYKGPPSAKW